MLQIMLIHPNADWRNRWTRVLTDMPGCELVAAVSNIREANPRLAAGEYDMVWVAQSENDAMEVASAHYPVRVVIAEASAPEKTKKIPAAGIFAHIAQGAEFAEVFQLLQTIRTYLHQYTSTYRLPNHFIFVKSEYKLIKIHLADILYLSGLRDYTQIFIKGKVSPLTTLQNLKDFENRLPTNDFIRVHRSYIVAIAHVDSISRNEITIGNNTIPIGHAYRPMLDEMIGKNG